MVGEGWSEMSDAQHSSIEKMNNFYCGLHVLVAVSDQSDATLKAWEQLVF
jgi:hypothetical protein